MKKSKGQLGRSAPTGRQSSTEEKLPLDALPRLQLCFFLSGAAGLIYEVVWTKQLAQLFGYSAYAVATVLAVFMGGLAAGSMIFARWRPWQRRGVALYAWMEFAIAVTALLTLPGIPLVRQIYLESATHFANSTAWSLALRLFGALAVLALPTILMGGTLPVLLAGVTREGNEFGARAGRFYAANTAGAVIGTLAAGFFLIPSIGLRLTAGLAAALNLLAGGLAGKFAARDGSAAEAKASASSLATNNSSAAMSRLYLFCFALVGATAIACEIGWTRLLATPLGSSTYAFSLMLATFLLGIALGSFIFEKWFRKRRHASSAVVAATQFAIAAAVLVSLWLYREIPELLLALLRQGSDQFSNLLFTQATACGLALLPAAIFFGFNFPAILSLISPASERSEIGLSGNVGRAVAANTLGAILSALLCGFVLLPKVGSFRVVAGAAFINILIGLLLFFKENARDWKPVAVALPLLAALIWTATSSTFFSQASAAFGVALYRSFHNSALTAREMADTEDVVFFKDGVNATIAVTRSENYVALKTNGKVDSSNLDSSTQLLLGDLGAIFHPNPRRILIIGFGGGMTVSAVSRFPEVERMDCVEIEPAVLEAAASLERLHRGVIRDPRLHIYFDDARNFLQTSSEHYDLIISEPSNPWIAGIVSLYTSEFFEVVRQHLSPGGNFVQWIQAYGLSTADFGMILASMQPHFRDMTLWHSAGRDFLVLARDSSEPLNLNRARALWQNLELQPDFATLHLSQPEGWAAYFRLGNQDLRQFTAGVRVNSDDRTPLEYTAPRHLLRPSFAAQLAQDIASAESRPFSDSFPTEDATRVAIASATTALDSHSDHAERYLRGIPVRDLTPERRLVEARVELTGGNITAAVRSLNELTGSLPNQFQSKYWLAQAQQEGGLLSDADATIREFLRDDPNSVPALRTRVKISSALKDWPDAIESQRRLSSLLPDLADEQCQLGDLLLRGRLVSEAEPPLRTGLQLDPYAFLCHRDLGELYRAAGRIADSIRELEWVVRYFPEADAKTYISLALAYQATGDKRRRQEAIEKGRRLFPADSLLGNFALSQ